MFSRHTVITFKVSAIVKRNETVCVVGNCPQLGNWKPEKSKQLHRTSTATNSNGKETWYAEVKVNADHEIHYRYFIAHVHEGEDGDDKDFLITRWETNHAPRKHAPGVKNPNEEEVAEFGTYGGETHIDKGWLTTQAEVHLRLHGNPINMYRTALKKDSFLIKCTPLDLRHQESVDAEDEDNEANLLVCPTNIDYVLLKNDSDMYREQDEFGCHFRENDYLIFRAQTLDLEYLGYQFTFYMPGSKGEDPKIVGHSYLLPVNVIHESHGNKTIPINGIKYKPIGELKVHYFIIKPMRGHNCDMKQSFSRHWTNRQNAYDVAHRGMGNSYTKRLAATRENTIASLSQASQHGADFVEFDIQLSRDLVPVVYHDMTVCLTLKQKQNQGLEYFSVPVAELNLIQLQQLRLDHTSELSNPCVKTEQDYIEPDTHKPFPTLQEICELVDPHVGFNIEIKYCLKMKGGGMEEGLKHFMERNEYVDRLLTGIFMYCGDRRVIISCFDPDVVTMIRMKQNKYPVLFLTIGECKAYEAYSDPRCWDIPTGASFVASEECLGIDPHAHDFLKDPSLVTLCKKKNLVVFCWGDDNNDAANIKKLKDMGVDGIIYDKISELKTGEKENVFKMEHGTKVKLLKEVGALDDLTSSSLECDSNLCVAHKGKSGDLV